LSALLDIDRALFQFVNTDMTNGLFDTVIPWLREPVLWAPVYLFIIGFCLFNFGKKGYFIIVFLALTAGTADFISNTVIKKNVERLRPCRALDADEVIKRVHCGSGYSFTSNHAANHFAISWYLIFLLPIGRRWLRMGLAVWAFAVAFAQVYVGVHYPLDVISGALLGVCIAWFWSRIFFRFS
jgi:undecaprenyl-diphosphatase